MIVPRICHSSAGFWARRYVEVLAVAALLFVLQTGLVPFDFQLGGGPEAARRFFIAAVSNLTLPDIMSNIFLYVPLGMLGHWVLLRRGRGRIRAWFTVLIAGAAVSATVEWLQGFSPERVSSLIDLTSNTVGVGVGASLSWVGRSIVPRLIGAALHEFHERPQASLVKTYAACLVVVAAVPFSLSFDVARFKQSVKASVFVPFGVSATNRAGQAAAVAASDELKSSRLAWSSLKRWSRWGAECASFAVLAWLLQPVLRGDYGFRRRTATALTWWLGGTLAVFLSMLQLPVISRGCDVTDVLFRLVGVWVGMATWQPYGQGGVLSSADRDARRKRLAFRAALAAVAFITYNGLIPLRFDFASGGPVAAIASEGFLPFFAYFFARFDLMMADVMEKFLSYAFLAAALATYWTRPPGGPSRRRVQEIVTLCLLLAAAIEIVQMFMPVRVAGLTDAIVALAGCVAGLVGQRHAVRFYRFATSRRTFGPIPEVVADSAGRLSPVDELIATLTEVDPGAPVERLPVPFRESSHP